VARLVAFGGDNERKALSDYDSLDLEALEVVRTWGVNGNGHKPRQWTFTPCPRPDCRRAIVDGWGGPCISLRKEWRTGRPPTA
jgi:hypothetical protein